MRPGLLRLASFLLASIALEAVAQSTNDQCSGAIPLTVGATCEIGNIVTANTTTNDPTTKPTCWTYNNDDGIWYKFTATATSLDINLGDNGSSYTPAVAVYNGGASPGTCPATSATSVFCKNYATGSGSLSLTGLTVGNVYYILADMPSTIAQAFCIQVTTPATNTSTCTATNLTINANSQVFSNNVATGGTYPTCWASNTCAGGGSSNTLNAAWYSFTVPAGGGTYDINVVSQSLPNAPNVALFLQGANCSSYSEVICSAGLSGSSNSLSSQSLAPGIYYVMVDGRCSQIGTFSIEVVASPPPAGSWATSCATASRIFPSTTACGMASNQVSNNSSYSVSGADDGTTGDPTPSCWAAGSNSCAQWYVFKATTTSMTLEPESYNFGGNVIWEDGTMVGGADMAVFSGGCASLSQVGCTTNVAANTGGMSLTGLTVGQDYYVMVDNTGTAACTFGSLCAFSTVNTTTAANNACSGATNVALGTSVTNNAFGATGDGALCSGSTENNIWYTVTAPTTGTYYISLFNQQCNGSRGAQASIYNSTTCTPSTGTCVASSNNQSTQGIYYTFSMTAGQTYLVNVDGFGGINCQFTLTFTNINPLPVELVSFGASRVKKTVELLWITASERNNAYFSVERSADGKTFYEVDRVIGQGTTSMKQEYKSVDSKPFEGTNYYRLKQVDFDGQFEYSEIATVKYYSDGGKTVNVFPNPVTNSANINFQWDNEENGSLYIVDGVGRKVLEKNIELKEGDNTIPVSIDHLPEGIYYLWINSSSETIKSRLFKN